MYREDEKCIQQFGQETRQKAAHSHPGRSGPAVEGRIILKLIFKK